LIAWAKVVERILKHSPKPQTPLAMAQRTLIVDNYLIALFNKDVIPLMPPGRMGRRIARLCWGNGGVLTKWMEWVIHHIITDVTTGEVWRKGDRPLFMIREER